MSIVERIDASVDFQFPGSTGSCTVRQLEEYIFNARMRGAEDDSIVKFSVKEGYPYDNRSYTKGMSVKVQATMGGFPVVPSAPPVDPAVVKAKRARRIAHGVMASPLVAAGVFVIAKVV